MKRRIESLTFLFSKGPFSFTVGNSMSQSVYGYKRECVYERVTNVDAQGEKLQLSHAVQVTCNSIIIKHTKDTLQVFKANLVRIQFNQILNGKETLWWTFTRSADRGLLLKRRLRADGHQLDEVILVHKAFVDANNEVSERLKLDKNDSCNVEG